MRGYPLLGLASLLLCAVGCHAQVRRINMAARDCLEHTFILSVQAHLPVACPHRRPAPAQPATPPASVTAKAALACMQIPQPAARCVQHARTAAHATPCPAPQPACQPSTSNCWHTCNAPTAPTVQDFYWCAGWGQYHLPCPNGSLWSEVIASCAPASQVNCTGTPAARLAAAGLRWQLPWA